jgi:hypothetical protein
MGDAALDLAGELTHAGRTGSAIRLESGAPLDEQLASRLEHLDAAVPLGQL